MTPIPRPMDPHVRGIMRENESESFAQPWKHTGSRWARRGGFTSLICCCGCFFHFIPFEIKGKIPHTRSCLCRLWHGAWTCFLTRSEDWGTMRGTCLCVHAVACECAWQHECVCWMERVKRLLNTTSPGLQIFHNYLEDQGFYFKASFPLWHKDVKSGLALRASSRVCFLIFIGCWCLFWWWME